MAEMNQQVKVNNALTNSNKFAVWVVDHLDGLTTRTFPPMRKGLLCSAVPLVLAWHVLFASVSAIADSNAWQYHIPYFLSAANPTQQSFVRVTYGISCLYDYHDGGVSETILSITAVDDAGVKHGPIEVQSVQYGYDYLDTTNEDECGKVIVFNSDDLEYGNPDKGISVGIGQGQGDWQLFLSSVGDRWTQAVGFSDDERRKPDVFVQSFIRTSDGFLTSMHDRAPLVTPPGYPGYPYYFIGTFNPARNTSQQSRLRIVNPNDFAVRVLISGSHDRASDVDPGPSIPLSAHASITVSATDLETYNSKWDDRSFGHHDGLLGDCEQDRLNTCNYPEGKWRLRIQAVSPQSRTIQDNVEELIVINLMETLTGHLTNLSTLFQVAPSGPTPPPTTPPEPEPPTIGDGFDFEFEFLGHVPQNVRDSFHDAADRWERIIIQGFPEISASFSSGACLNDSTVQREVDDLLVFVKIGNLDSGAAARAGLCATDRDSSVASRPYAAWIQVNGEPTDNYWENRRHDLFDKIVLHELGHALGFYPDTFDASGYLRRSPNTHFAGPKAREAFRQYERAGFSGEPVPMEPDGAHWHVGAFVDSGPQIYPELMAPQISKNSVLSRVTVQAFADLGYQVELNEADEWRGGAPELDAVRELVDLHSDNF